MDCPQAYCSLISSALAHREWRESSWRAPLTWSLHAQTHCGKNQGLDRGAAWRAWAESLSLSSQGVLFCPVVHKAFYGGSAMPGKKGIVVWGQSQEQTCTITALWWHLGLQAGMLCDSKQAPRGPSDSELDVHIMQPALGDCVRFPGRPVQHNVPMAQVGTLTSLTLSIPIRKQCWPLPKPLSIVVMIKWGHM